MHLGDLIPLMVPCLATLCTWCSTWRGDKICSSCRGARYCSEKHQVMHWRSGHNIDCRRLSISSQSSSSSLSNSTTTSAEINKG
ncbi:hypothetical protein HHK36_026421 [Tetracentron sinense]|uniref:MYND-type domain-containing protein n=1 Tax=Tetracentron sinense TaxID=13715 RepID=A0A835D2M3_TETSI|nr:hypothetical protein HHK36_026421 [Tetracentron sinense]